MAGESVPKLYEVNWRHIGGATLLFGGVVVITYALVAHMGLNRGSIVFLIPVVIAAARWGAVPALATVFLGLAASAFFFYEPIYSFWVSDPQEYLNLALFIFVAIVTGHLATRLKQQAELAEKREVEMRDLYAFSRRLAAAFATSDIHAAIEDHLTDVLQRRVVLFPAAESTSDTGERRLLVPHAVNELVKQIAARAPDADHDGTVADERGNVWLVRAISPSTAEFGVIAIDFGKKLPGEIDEDRSRVERVLADANATLERLGVASAISDARMRAQTEQLREALIGSVSHELRTPLASILGAATVLSAAPAVAKEKKLSALANDVRDEAERLNRDIQNLLDASRISSNGVRPRNEWTDPADIVNSAVQRCKRRLNGHRLELEVPADLPLVEVDSALIQQTLVQVLDNAAKYSSPESRIAIRAHANDKHVVFSVRDEGVGLTAQEQSHMWERFFRGPRHRGVTSGSGLGLWIAHAFVSANGGRIAAESEGDGHGTTFSIELPVTHAALPQLESETDE
jgi:two-component system sensor histidine kinase KdpD